MLGGAGPVAAREAAHGTTLRPDGARCCRRDGRRGRRPARVGAARRPRPVHRRGRGAAASRAGRAPGRRRRARRPDASAGWWRPRRTRPASTASAPGCRCGPPPAGCPTTRCSSRWTSRPTTRRALEVMAVLRSFPVVVEVLGWDEAFLGVGDRRPGGAGAGGPGRACCERDRGCTARSGSATTSCRPRSRRPSASREGIGRLTSDDWVEVMGDRPTTALWGIGAKTARRLAEPGHRDRRPARRRRRPAARRRRSARRWGRGCGGWAAASTPRRSTPRPWVPRAHGRETTFQVDLTDWDEVAREARRLAAHGGRGPAPRGPAGGAGGRQGALRALRDPAAQPHPAGADRRRRRHRGGGRGAAGALRPRPRRPPARRPGGDDAGPERPLSPSSGAGRCAWPA